MPAGVKEPISRVFMTADAVGGVWPYTIDLAEGLGAEGIETVLAVLGPAPSVAQLSALRRLSCVQLIETGLSLDWTARSEAELRDINTVLAELAAGCRPDLVHLHAPALAGFERFDVPTVATAHSCVATWWNAVRSGPMPEEFLWRSGATRRGLESVGQVIAASAGFAAALRKAYGESFAITVIPNGRVRSPSLLREKQHLIFTAGRLWDEGKNIRVLDRAAEHIDAPIFAAGPLAGPHGVTAHFDNLKLLGTLDAAAMAHWLASAPVFAASARYEPFGLAVLEAAQASAALVLSDIPSFRELWEGAAIFVDPEDEEAWAMVLQMALDAPARRRELGAAAEARSKRYSRQAMVSATLALYREVLAAQHLVSPPPLSRAS